MDGDEHSAAQTILIVDDNRDLADNVAELLALPGRTTTVAYTATEAYRLAETRAFDLAVIDLRLPDESGVSVATRLKELHPEIEAILMTANATLDTAITAVQKGLYAYVQKPFDPGELLALSGRALTQVRLQRERQKLEQKLTQSEALYRGVTDAVGSFIVGLDAGGIVRMWNRSAEDGTGHLAETLIGRPLAELMVSEVARARLADVLAEVERGNNVSNVELAVRHRAGGQRLVRWRFGHFAGGDTPPLALGVGEDLTDRLELERRAAEAEAMASLGALTAGLAHEIRNPLNAASLQLQLLKRSADAVVDGAARERFSTRVVIVREELERLTNLLNDFLQLARPQQLALHPVDLTTLVTEAAQLQQPEAARSGCEIRAHTTGEPLYARGDRAMLKQVLVNLIANALDAMRSMPGGQIDVRCQEASEARIELSVEDEGCGIDPAVADTLLSPFVTTKEAGTGLGLTIVKRIVNRHGGTLSFRSRAGGGTAVHVVLQRAQPEPAGGSLPP